MELTSPAFEDGEDIPLEYTCDGDNINPALSISYVPPEAKSSVLIMDDPDAPEEVFVHWLLCNINPKISEIKEGQVPEGAVQGLNSAGQKKYTGPCPATGTHRYFFRLFALDKTLEISPNFERGEVEDKMAGHIIAQTQLMGLYGREEEEEVTETLV